MAQDSCLLSTVLSKQSDEHDAQTSAALGMAMGSSSHPVPCGRAACASRSRDIQHCGHPALRTSHSAATPGAQFSTQIPALGEGCTPCCSLGSTGAFGAAAEQNHRVVGCEVLGFFLLAFFSFYNFLCEIKLNKQALLGALRGREPAFLQMCVSSAITTAKLSFACGWDICKLSPFCLPRFCW